MSTVSAGSVLEAQLARYTQQKQGLADTARIIEPPRAQQIIIKPRPTSWEALEQKLSQVINLDGLWIRVRQLYDAGQGAELETAAEIALAKARKNPRNMFAAMVSKSSDNWETRTLKTVHDTWDVRRDTVEVMDRLKLPRKSLKPVLAIAWRLRGTIIQYLGRALEQGTGIKNPIGLFFALTKHPKPSSG